MRVHETKSVVSLFANNRTKYRLWRIAQVWQFVWVDQLASPAISVCTLNSYVRRASVMHDSENKNETRVRMRQWQKLHLTREIIQTVYTQQAFTNSANWKRGKKMANKPYDKQTTPIEIKLVFNNITLLYWQRNMTKSNCTPWYSNGIRKYCEFMCSRY